MKDWPEDLQAKEIAKMDVDYLVRFALEQKDASVTIVNAVTNRAVEIGIQVRTVERIKHQVHNMKYNIEALPWNQ